jgi:hypothetical protein
MAGVILLLQIVITLVVTALSLPALLGTVPALRNQPAGLAVMAVVMAVTFVGLRLIWPRRKT